MSYAHTDFKSLVLSIVEEIYKVFQSDYELVYVKDNWHEIIEEVVPDRLDHELNILWTSLAEKALLDFGMDKAFTIWKKNAGMYDGFSVKSLLYYPLNDAIRNELLYRDFLEFTEREWNMIYLSLLYLLYW